MKENIKYEYTEGLMHLLIFSFTLKNARTEVKKMEWRRPVFYKLSSCGFRQLVHENDNDYDYNYFDKVQFWLI
jgi:hypothetical protein